MIETVRLSIRLLRRHLSLYAGFMVTVGASAVLAATEGGLVEAFSHPDRIAVPGRSADEVVQQAAQVQGLFTIFALLVIITSGFMVWSAVKQVVSFRERELALMRLAGASRGLLSRTVAIECTTLALVVALPAAFLGTLITPALFAGLKAIGFFGSGVEVQFSIPLGVILITAALLAVTSGTGGLLAARAATRGDLLSAVNPVARSMSWLQVVVRLVIAILGAAAIATLDPVALGANLILLLPLLVVAPLVAIAPFLVPVGAWLIGRIVGLFAPGPGVLAAERASKERLRFARMAAPAIVAVGVLGGFLVANAPDEQLTAEIYSERLAASTVAATIGVTETDQTATALRDAGATQVARLTTRTHLVQDETERLYFSDPPAFAELVRQNVTAGDLTDVTGYNVASSNTVAEIGDKLASHDAAGNPITLTVVAVIEDELWEGLWLNWSEVSNVLDDPATLSTEIYASPITQAQATAAISAAGLDATAVDRAGFLQIRIQERAANTSRSNIGVFGTIYLMCVISLFQSAVSSSLARRREFRILNSLGVGRRGIVQTVLTETIIVQLVAGLLVAAILIALGFRFAVINGTSALAAITSVIPQTAISYASLFIAALLAQLLGASIALSGGAGLDSTQTEGQ